MSSSMDDIQPLLTMLGLNDSRLETLTEEFLKLWPKEALLLLAEAGQAESQGDNLSAVCLLDEVLKLIQDWSVARFRKAVCLLKLEKHEEALVEFETFLKQETKSNFEHLLHGSLPEHLVRAANDERVQYATYIIGWIKKRLGEHKEAAAFFQRVDADSEYFIPARVGLAQALCAAGEIEESIDLLRCLLKEHRDEPTAWLALGECLVAKGDEDGAAEAFKEAIAKEDAAVDVYLSIAGIWREEGRYREAINVLREAVIAYQKTDPETCTHLLQLLADSAYRLQDYEDALEWLQRIPSERLTANDHKLRGLCLWGWDEEEKAIESFMSALAIDPLNEEALQSLARLHTNRQEYAAAIDLLQQALATNEHNLLLHGELAAVLASAGDEQQALQALQRLEGTDRYGFYRDIVMSFVAKTDNDGED